MSGGPTIYHGTPMTPRAAIRAIGPGRAMCVSFYHPQDAEVVEAISPAIMFRQRRLLRVEGSARSRRGMVRSRGLDAVLRLARAAAVLRRSVGGDTRCAWRAVADQRFLAAAMAVRSIEGRAALAHGRPDRAATPSLREVRSCLLGLDRNRRGRRCGLRSLVPADGRDRAAARQPAAGASPHARRSDRARIRLHRQRGRQHGFAERMAL